MRKPKLAIIGVTGRMGTQVFHLAKEFSLRPTSGVSRSDSDESYGIPIVKRVELLDPEMVDVVIDYSLPNITDDVIKWCVKYEKPLVSGVTGVTNKQRLAMARAGKTVPMLWSPNMSVGIAVMARAMRVMAGLKGFDFQIEELHHKNKKDQPSGTAKLLQERLVDAVGHDLPQPISVRAGDVVGIHKLWAMGEDEIVTIEHTAMNRSVFARGALRAAKWIQTMPAGLYSMDDLLGT